MTKSPSSSTICLLNFFCVPIASMVIIQPERDSFWSNNGMAVISFDFLSTATCANTRRFSAAHALTICNAFFPSFLSAERRSVLPSMASTPSTAPLIPCTHSKKHASNSTGLRCANTRPNVSCDGIPFGNSKIVLSYASFERPNCSTSTHPSAPQIVPHIATIMISSSLCLFVLSILGSLNDDFPIPIRSAVPSDLPTVLDPILPLPSFRCDCPARKLQSQHNRR